MTHEEAEDCARRLRAVGVRAIAGSCFVSSGWKVWLQDIEGALLDVEEVDNYIFLVSRGGSRR